MYRVAANAKGNVTTQGASMGLNYYFKNYALGGNYSWNVLNKKGTDDPIIPAFNTPEHKFNISLNGRKLKLIKRLGNNFGFGINYKWIDGFVFEGSPQFTGFVPSYDMVDAQVNYEWKDKHTTFKLGASNILGIVPLFDGADSNKRRRKKTPVVGIIVSIISSSSLTRDRKSTRLNSSHVKRARMPSSA